MADFGIERDLRWLVGHLARHIQGPIGLPPRLAPLVDECREDHNPSEFTLAMPMAPLAVHDQDHRVLWTGPTRKLSNTDESEIYVQLPVPPGTVVAVVTRPDTQEEQ